MRTHNFLKGIVKGNVYEKTHIQVVKVPLLNKIIYK